jgi:hypothetical protein
MSARAATLRLLLRFNDRRIYRRTLCKPYSPIRFGDGRCLFLLDFLLIIVRGKIIGLRV